MNNNVLEFFVKMKDMMSGGLVRLSQNAQRAFTNVQENIDRTVRRNRELANSFNDVARSAKSSLGSIGDIIKGNLGADAIKRVIGTGVEFIKDTIGSAMSFGMTKKSFEVLTGSEQKGQGLANELNKLQQDTILGPEVFKNAQTMMGFGIGSDKMIADIKMLGDVSMGNAEKMQSLTLAFSQVSAAGKLTGQDLLQFVNAGFNPLNEISKQTGKSIGQLKGDMEKGLVTFSMVEDAFKSATGAGGLYNNMLNKLAETPAGKMQQLQGQFEAFKVKVGEALMPLATVGLDAMNELLNVANQFIPYIVKGVNFIRDGIASINDPTSQWATYLGVVKSVALNLWTVLKSVAGNVWHIVSGMIDFLSKSQLVKDAFSLIGWLAEGALKIIGRIGNALSWYWDNIVKPWWNIIDKVYSYIKDLFKWGGKDISVTSNQNVIYKPSDTVRATDVGKSLANNISNQSAASSRGAGNIAKGITGGGPRVININGVKFTDKIEIHNATARESTTDLQRILEEMFLRILNSGAALQ